MKTKQIGTNDRFLHLTFDLVVRQDGLEATGVCMLKHVQIRGLKTLERQIFFPLVFFFLALPDRYI